MNKILCALALCSGSFYTMHPSSATSYTPLQMPTSGLTVYNEIAISPNASMVPYFNKLTPEQRIFAYYMHRALVAGTQIYRKQLHRSGPQIISLYETILKNQNTLRALSPSPVADLEGFLSDVTIMAVYAWTNHSQYFHREHSNEKRTPARLGLTSLTPENLTAVLRALGDADAATTVQALRPMLFDASYEPTLVVPGSIDQSASALYAQGLTDADYQTLSIEDQSRLNATFGKNENGQPYASVARIGELYGKELEAVCSWLSKAYAHASAHPEQFDAHLVKSLTFLIEYFTTGDEEKFKQHSIEWLQSKSKDIDITFGFIEVYGDPKGQRGMLEGDITVKTVDLEKLNSILPNLESQLPFPDDYKRDMSDPSKIGLPNASINTVLFAGGELGPLKSTAAYCLPNYEEIRSEFGSKQIIYESDKGLGALLNKEKSLTLGMLASRADWVRANDPESTLSRDLWKLHVILHETIGHGSGKLATHTFRDGDLMTIDNVTYAVGDTISVTNKNLPQFLSGYESALEELRAEILAMYLGTHHFEELKAIDLWGPWADKLSKEELLNAYILSVANGALSRLLSQDVNATEISGAHARADCTITHFLVDGRGLAVREEERVVDGQTYTILGCEIVDRDAVFAGITELAQRVQKIKSTGDTQDVATLIGTYGTKPLKPDYIKIMRRNNEAVVGKLRAHALLFPHLTPVYDGAGIVDINATWPVDIIEQNLHLAEIALSTE